MTDVPRTIDQVFTAAAVRQGAATHLVLPDGTAVPYAETLARARRLATVLNGAGVKCGDRVAAFMPSSRELFETYVGCSLAGAIAVPVNGLNTVRENRLLFADCAPAGLLADTAMLDRVPADILPASMGLRLATRGEPSGWRSYDAAIADAADGPLSSPSAPEDAGLIIYSSGTTGNPKGIVLRQRALVEDARLTAAAIGYRASDRFLTLLPTYSSFGFSFDFLQAGLVGASTVITPAFDAAAAVALVERHRVTCLAGVPTMFVRMADHMPGRDLTSLRLIDVGGGPVPERLKEDLRATLGVQTVESYGLTEISPVASVQRPGAPTRPGSCGPPLPGFLVRVVDPLGRDVATGEAGELLFRCETRMIGYWNQPELTASTLRDGWLHSGDIGRVDEHGEIYILDRLKDMIVTSGNNVYPKEVEIVIFDHPAVQAVAVAGVPDEVRGENVHAFIVRHAGASVSAEEIIEHCRRNLARFKVPRGVTFIDALPLTASGKIRRFKLREMAAAAGSGGRA